MPKPIPVSVNRFCRAAAEKFGFCADRCYAFIVPNVAPEEIGAACPYCGSKDGVVGAHAAVENAVVTLV